MKRKCKNCPERKRARRLEAMCWRLAESGGARQHALAILRGAWLEAEKVLRKGERQ